ncbi:MAG TPA: hypothetical protein VKT17_05530, partial [Acidobacteriota bacterium]|nr:hypothetical protein [Acidobacteriota bacterium]
MRRNAERGLPSPAPSADVPLVLPCGWALYRRGGYGARFGVAVENRREIASEIRKLKAAGAGIIKVMASGLVSLMKPGVITPGGFSR